MRRVSALFLLVALAFPYAKAPLCQAGSHEHQEEMSAHQHHGSDQHRDSDQHLESADLTSLGSTFDCHELMQCQVAVDVVRANAAVATSVAWAPAANGWRNANQPDQRSRAPEPPPPQFL